MDERTVRDVLVAHGLRAGSVRELGAGLDHAAYVVDDELVVRLVRGDGDRSRVTHEARLLTAVAAAVPVPVPEPVVVDGERGCLAYRRLRGTPVLGLAGLPDHAVALGATLGRFLAALHGVPGSARLADVDDAPLREWLAEARAAYPRVRTHVPRRHRAGVEAFLAAEPPAAGGTPVLAHNDLGTEHVLVDPSTWEVTGILDWGDAAVTDRSRDLGLVLRDLGPAALDAALAGYGPVTDGDVARAWFHARCGALEDLAYGLETADHRYAAASLGALDWLFPVSAAASGP